MSNIYTSAEQLIGKTPLMELTHLEEKYQLKAKVLGCLFSMISNYEPGEKVFLFNNGLNAMKTILFSETETNTVYRKVLVLLLQMARAETPYMVSVVYLCSLVEKVPFRRAGEPVV